MSTQSESETVAPDPSARSSRILAPALAVAVCVWIAWFILHLPAVAAPPALAGPVIGLVWLIAGAGLARAWGLGARTMALAGLTTAAVCLLLLGSMLVRPDPDAGFTTGSSSFIQGALPVTLGFLASGAILGALGALAARRSGAGATPPAAWHSRLAWTVAASFLPLLLIGGVVTSTESGLAVTDWPSTFGANMFLYPQELMREQPRVYFEHTHRLFGTLVGLCTLTFWITTLASAPARRRFGIWATLLFVAVCIQGFLGGQRVVQQNAFLGAVHGALGQVLLAFAAVLALWMSPTYIGMPALHAKRATRPLRTLMTAALAASLLQLLLGALFRHLRREDDPGATHVVWTHAALALVVVTLAIIAGSLLIRFGKENRDALGRDLMVRLRLHGVVIHATVVLQFVLGWAALLAVLSGPKRAGVPTASELPQAQPVPLAEAVLGTAHQANGALYLLLLAMAWAWARRVHRAAAP